MTFVCDKIADGFWTSNRTANSLLSPTDVPYPHSKLFTCCSFALPAEVKCRLIAESIDSKRFWSLCAEIDLISYNFQPKRTKIWSDFGIEYDFSAFDFNQMIWSQRFLSYLPILWWGIKVRKRKGKGKHKTPQPWVDPQGKGLDASCMVANSINGRPLPYHGFSSHRLLNMSWEEIIYRKLGALTLGLADETWRNPGPCWVRSSG